MSIQNIIDLIRTNCIRMSEYSSIYDPDIYCLNMFLYGSLNNIIIYLFVSTLVLYPLTMYVPTLVPFSYTPGVSKLWDRSLGTVLGCVWGTTLINKDDG